MIDKRMIGRWKLLQEVKLIQNNTYAHYTEIKTRNRNIKINHRRNEIEWKRTPEIIRINRITKIDQMNSKWTIHNGEMRHT